MGRKTFVVEDVLAYANQQLARTDEWSNPQNRWGVIQMIENILHSSGNYSGFRYLTNNELPENVTPGVRRGPNSEILEYEESFANTDETRRVYF